jgi:hypothetical protein
MVETIALDKRTMLLKSDNEIDIDEIVNMIIQRNKMEKLKSFLNFASENRIVDNTYKFNREDCYDR